MSKTVPPRTRVGVAALVTVALVLLGWLGLSWGLPWLLRKEGGRNLVVNLLGRPTIPMYAVEPLEPTFEGSDRTRKQMPVWLDKVADGFRAPTDLQFVPGMPSVLLVASKSGRCEWVDLERQTRGLLFSIDVPAHGELGLLGLAFHPRFADNGRLYIHHSTGVEGALGTRIASWQVKRTSDGSLGEAIEKHRVLETEQPYSNHNGGQIAFGPDGMLYIGLGDGGDGGDPHGHGQRLDSLLGKILRIDVDRTEGERAYAIPSDNPFVGVSGARSEVWAYGLRNPWRFAFDDSGRLIVADVGQDKWEEISFVARGDNLGWKQREADTCFHAPADGAPCKDLRMREPFHVYGRDDGQSITGGHVYRATELPELNGKYVFADFVRGRFWALPLPTDNGSRVPAEQVLALGRFTIMPSAFARDYRGNLYVADFGHSSVYRLVPPAPEVSR